MMIWEGRPDGATGEKDLAEAAAVVAVVDVVAVVTAVVVILVIVAVVVAAPSFSGSALARRDPI